MSNRRAYDEIYERYWCKLYTTALKRIGSEEDAKDLVQDLFISLWIKREILEIKVSLSAYLFSAIKYRIINYIESNLVKSNYLKTLEKAFDYDNSTNEKILCNDLERFLESGIKSLSPKVKEVFVLSRMERLSNNEIASKLDVSEQTVKNQISKALKTLKLHLHNISAILFPLILLGSTFL